LKTTLMPFPASSGIAQATTGRALILELLQLVGPECGRNGRLEYRGWLELGGRSKRALRAGGGIAGRNDLDGDAEDRGGLLEVPGVRGTLRYAALDEDEGLPCRPLRELFGDRDASRLGRVVGDPLLGYVDARDAGRRARR